MKVYRWSELFALLFDPRVPTLFLVGSILIALLSNAVYDLLLTLIGTTPQTLIAVAIGSLACFLFVLRGFQMLLRVLAARRPLDHTPPPPEQQAEPHASLVLAVGLSEPGPERRLIEWHQPGRTLRRCWLIVSPEVEQSQKFKDLRFWLYEQNVEVYTGRVLDARQPDQVYAAVQHAIREAQHLTGHASLIVDITGGLKPMTAGAVLACRDAQVPIQYLVAPRDRGGQPIGNADHDGIVMKVALQQADGDGV